MATSSSRASRRFDLGGAEGLAVFKAMGNPVRQRILRTLEREGPANSTSLAKELDESTGTTSYHLRQLAECGLIEEIPERSTGRERWWRAVKTDFRTPPLEQVAPEARALAAQWQERKIDNDLRLMRKAIDDFHAGDTWVTASRWGTYLTRDELRAFNEEYLDLINRYGHSRYDAPAGAEPVSVRMFAVRDPERDERPSAMPSFAEDTFGEDTPVESTEPNIATDDADAADVD